MHYLWFIFILWSAHNKGSFENIQQEDSYHEFEVLISCFKIYHDWKSKCWLHKQKKWCPEDLSVKLNFLFCIFQASKGNCEVHMECKTRGGGRDRSYFFCTFPHCVCHSLHSRVMLSRANAKKSVISAG